MEQIPDGVVSLVVCSPPYNVQKPYSNHNDDMGLPEYKKMLLAVWRECKRVLRPGGRLCINVAGCWRQPYLPLHAIIWQQLTDKLDFQMRGEIIWDKGASAGVSTAWGSFASPSNPTLRDVHEYILIAQRSEEAFPITHDTIGVFSKEDFNLSNFTGENPDITKEEFVMWTRSIWDMPTESPSRVNHPAPFPEELPRRLILLYTYPGDIVLDPFAGVGSTCVAALMTNRHYIGYEIDKVYVRKAKQRISNAGTVARALWPEYAISAKKKGDKMSKETNFTRINATALVENQVRRREVTVATKDNEVLLGVKATEIQKQNITASLSARDALQLARSILKAAESLLTREETKDDQ